LPLKCTKTKKSFFAGAGFKSPLGYHILYYGIAFAGVVNLGSAVSSVTQSTIEINRLGKFAIEQIYVALTKMIEEKIPIYDKYKRQGTLVNVSNYYLFQPIEIDNENITIFERMVPIQTKPTNIGIKDLVTQDEIAQIGSDDDG
jgi:hypothetical protein